VSPSGRLISFGGMRRDASLPTDSVSLEGNDHGRGTTSCRRVRIKARAGDTGEKIKRGGPHPILSVHLYDTCTAGTQYQRKDTGHILEKASKEEKVKVPRGKCYILGKVFSAHQADPR